MPVSTARDYAFPTLSQDEMHLLRGMAQVQDLANGETVFKVGDADIDFIVVESGQLDILNPANDDQIVVSHKESEFAGDIDMITRRPVIVTAVAHGPTRVLRVPGEKLRDLLNRIPRLSEKLIDAFTTRRRMLSETGAIGVLVVGPGRCRDTNLVREFLDKNFVPFMWFDSETPEGARRLMTLGSPRKSPVIKCGDGKLLVNPTLRELARCVGVLSPCPLTIFDLAIVGAGPAGISAAVYAASEGLTTLVVDRTGPGGQTSGSSRIENFIGFPAGLTGTELAMRGVLQMMKFGARLATPVAVEHFEPATPEDGLHKLHLDCGNVARARTVLIATGVCWRRLEAEGAAAFENSGVFYVCTKTEAVLYDLCDVAVVGGGNSAGQAAVFMAEYCNNRHVHLLVRHRLEAKMSSYLVDRIRSADNITVHEGVEISRVHGRRRIESVDLKTRGGLPCGSVALNAVFVFTGADPYASWLPDKVARDKLGYLLTGAEVTRNGKWPLKDRDPCPLETSIPGLLAAGDVRSASTKRVGFAVGDGSLAVSCAHNLRSIAAARVTQTQSELATTLE